MNDKDATPNIALSGWVGSGTSTLTILLAVLLKQKYYYLGSLFRHIDAKLFAYKSETMSSEFETTIQPLIGSTVDRYVDYILTEKNGIILEADISAFRIGKTPKVFSIFLKTRKEIREARTKSEASRITETTLSERDETLRQEYIKLWDIDIFDEELIQRKYNLIIDNSDLSIEEEIEQVFDHLQNHRAFGKLHNYDKLRTKIAPLVAEYKEIGKDGMIDKIKKRDIYVKPEVMLLDITKVFPEDVENYPLEVQKVFLGQ